MEKFKTEREQARTQFEADRKVAREQLQEKLKMVKDERKKEVAQKVGTQFNEINAKITAQLDEHVDKIDEVLTRIANRASELAIDGVDSSSALSAVEAAKTAIANARDAISVQTAKAYTVDVTSEENLKNDFGLVRKQLGDDLKGVKGAVASAREAVRSAGQALPRQAPEEVTLDGEDGGNQ